MTPADIIPSPEPHWYCVHTKPKCEHLVARALCEFAGVESYCPRLRFQRATPRGKVWFTEALFPSYLFARFDLTTSLRAVKHARNVIRVLEFGDIPVALPDESVAEIKRQMQGAELREVTFTLQVGDAVEVAEGPMRGLKGIVERIENGEERVRILLEFLGRDSFVKIPASKLLNERQPRDMMAL